MPTESNAFDRTRLLLGDAAMERLSNASVAVVGLGGVGGACAEALARCGIGRLILMDNDTVDVTNQNRQLFATSATVGLSKTEAARRRLAEVCPDLRLKLLEGFYSADTADTLFLHNPNAVADAIDTVTSKLHLAAECRKRNIFSISCLGTGNRLDPSSFRLGTIEDTSGIGCGLARVMRRECRKRGLDKLPVVYSLEPPAVLSSEAVNALGSENGRHPPASISFCPPVAGYLLASWIIKQLIAL